MAARSFPLENQSQEIELQPRQIERLASQVPFKYAVKKRTADEPGRPGNYFRCSADEDVPVEHS
jgi:hypothetical protein